MTGNVPDTPEYWQRAKRALARRDAVMGRIIRAYPRIALQRRGDPFRTLARAIVGQQISVKAAQSVWDRVVAAAPTLAPEAVVGLRVRRLRACGLSERKAEYLRDLARHFVDDSMHLDRWPQMDDEAVIAELVQVRGIGRWTAEMFLIFRLGRPDVLPADDYGVRKGFSVALRKRELPARKQLEKYAERWRPYRTAASWYLWRAVELAKQ